MANRTHENRQFDQRRNRYFSEGFKKKVVDQIEKNLASVSEISVEYGVSRGSVYKWVYTYSSLYKKGYKQIIEPMSDTKKIKQLKDKIKELERLVGQKQIQLEFSEKMIELAEKQYGIDIKKKGSSTPSAGTGKSGKSTPGA